MNATQRNAAMAEIIRNHNQAVLILERAVVDSLYAGTDPMSLRRTVTGALGATLCRIDERTAEEVERVFYMFTHRHGQPDRAIRCADCGEWTVGELCTCEANFLEVSK